MNNAHLAVVSALAGAIGLASAPIPAFAQAGAQMPQVVRDNMARATRDKLEHCYGINAAAKNDCAEGVHSCAGQATMARDTKSFVLVPAGVCAKIAGGSTKAM